MKFLYLILFNKVADAGGLLGLFLGISFLSIVDSMLGFIVNLLSNIKMNKKIANANNKQQVNVIFDTHHHHRHQKKGDIE